MIKSLKIILSGILVGQILSSPAKAHLGDHAGFDLAALAAHLLEWDHVLFAVGSALIGWASYRAGRNAEARAIRLKGHSHDPR